MNAPITWRNIEAPDFRGASAGLTAASNNLEAARKLFTQSIADTERIDAENWANTKANNTNAELKHLLGYKDLESFEKAKQAGEFLTRLDQYGAQIDTDRVLKAIDERADVLRNRAINELGYQNRVRTEEEARVAREQKPIVDRLLGLITQGELTAATGAARAYADSRMLREDFLRQILEGARQRQEGIQDRELRTQQVLAEIRARDAQAAAARAQAAAANQQFKTLRDLIRLGQDADKTNQGYIQEWLKNSPLGAGTLETSEGRASLENILSRHKLSGNAAADVRQNLEKYFPGGYYTRIVNGKKVQIPIPVSLIDQALSATDEFGDGSVWSRRGDKVRDYALAALEDPNYFKMLEQALRVRDENLATRAEIALRSGVSRIGPEINAQTLLRLGQLMNPQPASK